MKRLACLLAALVLPFCDPVRADTPGPSSAPPPPRQAPQQLIAEPLTFGGFGGPFAAWTRVHSEDVLLLGIRGGWVIDHHLVLGLAGAGVIGNVAVPDGATPDDADYRLELGYGGFWIEYVVAPSRLVHGTLGALIGGGSASYTRFRGSGGPDESEQEDPLFVFEPSLALELNVVSFMRVDLYAAYRFFTGIDLAKLRPSDINGFGLGLILKFGTF